GDEFDSARCNTIRGVRRGTSPVGAYPAAPSGCVDLCGNVWEMTCNADREHEQTVIVKGGSWYDYPAHAKIDHRFRAPIDRVGRTVGFRVCYGRPERHPRFLDEQRVRADIEQRRHAPRAAPEDPAEEFDFGELRAEPGPAMRVLAPAEPLLTADHQDVAGMLAWFDEAGERLPISEEANKNTTSGVRDAIVSRVQTILVNRPGLMLTTAVAALLLVATTLVAAVTDDSRERGTRQAPEAATAPPEARSTPTRPRRIIRRITRVPVSRDSKKAPETRESIQRALQATSDRAEQSRLRYLLAKLDEDRDGPGEPMPLTVLPSRGLVFVCDRVGPAEQRCIEMLRRLGTVERLDVTLVYTGSMDIAKLIAAHAKSLGSVFVVTDPEKLFAPAHDLTGSKAVLGLRTDGRAAFMLHGTPTRARLAQKLGALR
ncbi:MAG: formylglycine-generating enzyme family protein, partial [Planctomycetota bacterium]